jgi:hypothetical protein
LGRCNGGKHRLFDVVRVACVTRSFSIPNGVRYGLA